MIQIDINSFRTRIYIINRLEDGQSTGHRTEFDQWIRFTSKQLELFSYNFRIIPIGVTESSVADLWIFRWKNLEKHRAIRRNA